MSEHTKAVGAGISLPLGALRKGQETQQVEFLKNTPGLGIFSQHLKCGFKWKTQPIRAKTCLDEENPLLPHCLEALSAETNM